jgi:predicted heme/steroid binding protein
MLKAKSAAPRSAGSSVVSAHSLLANFVPKGNGRIVTQKELAENCGRGSDSGKAWVALHGHVFDITEFSKTHPGGHSIRLAAGRSESIRCLTIFLLCLCLSTSVADM